MEDGGSQFEHPLPGAHCPATTHPPSSTFARVVLAVLTVAAVGRVVTHEFTGFDDPGTISNNPAFNPPTLPAIAHYWVAPEGALYAPLSYTTWGLLAFVARVDQPDDTGSLLNPWVYHAANLSIHVAATMIVFALVTRLTRSQFAAWFGAALFAIHPVQVEPLAWASGTKDLLCGLFIVLSLYAWVRHRALPQTGNRSWVAVAIFAMLLACLSKPTGIVAAPMLVVLDRALGGHSWRRSLAALAPAFVIAIAFAIVGILVQPPVMAQLPPPWARPLIATDALAFYVSKLAWPVKLSIDYGRTPRVAIDRGWIYYTWLLLLAVIIVIRVARRYIPLVAVGAAVALLGIAPVLGLAPFTFQAYSTVADHYLYPSMIGVAVAMAALVARFDRPVVRCVLLLVVLVLCVRSFIAAGTWRDSASLFSHALEVNRDSFLALTGLGADDLRRGRHEEARQHLRAAIEVNPDYAFARLSMGNLLLEREDARGALEQYRELFRIYVSQRNYNPRLASDVLTTIGNRMLRDGHVDEAIDALQDATRRDPTNERAARELEAAMARRTSPATTTAP